MSAITDSLTSLNELLFAVVRPKLLMSSSIATPLSAIRAVLFVAPGGATFDDDSPPIIDGIRANTRLVRAMFTLTNATRTLSESFSSV